MKCLSYTMQQALKSILAQGRLAIPEGGGWWKGEAGIRLSYPPKEGSIRSTVPTGTIYSLVSRGFLRRRNLNKWPHKDTYEITDQVLIVGDPWATHK